MFVDVHTHLTHAKFHSDCDAVIQRAIDAGLGAIVVNGLEPQSNRKILAMAAANPIIQPALGIYPIEAINHLKPELSFPISNFDVDQEINFIEKMASENKLAAIGECGLDGYWVDQTTFKEQERVFVRLIEIAKTFDKPLIIHTRKLEKRSIEILKEMNIRKVNFHCYGGKVKMAIRAAEEHGWYFSIPTNCRKNEAFTKMLLELPETLILTETDAPYLAAEKGERNEPSQVVNTIAYLAELRKWPFEQAKEQVWSNYLRLFSKTN